MYKLDGKNAVVTGASKGFGELLSYELASRGAHVIGVARSENLLEDLQKKIGKERFSYISGDLGQKTSIKDVMKAIYEKYNGAEIMAFNAGMFEIKPVEDVEDEDKAESLMNINQLSPIRTFGYWLKEYKDGFRKPEIAFWLGSVSSLRSWAGGDVYQATKSGIAAFAYARRIIDKGKIRHIVAYPGTTETEMTREYKGAKIPKEIVVNELLKSLEGKDEYGRYDDIAITIPEEDPVLSVDKLNALSNEEKKSIYTVFYPTDENTNRPNIQEAKLHKLAGPERVIKSE